MIFAFVKAPSPGVFRWGMKRSLLRFGLIFFGAAVAHADLVVVQRVEGDGRNQAAEMTIKCRGDKIRADISPEVSTIADTATGDVTTLLHVQKVCMKIEARAVEQLAARLKEKPEADAVRVKPQPTGKKEDIGGIPTEIFVSQLGQTKITYWVARDYPLGDRLREMLARLESSPLNRISRGEFGLSSGDLPGVAIKTYTVFPNGQKLTVTLISVKEQEVDPSEFQIPKTYQLLPSPAFSSPPKIP